MKSLIWMLVWLPQALLAMNGLPKPINDILNSSHFIHILTWEPGPGTPPGVHYDVRVLTETGTSWVPVVGCEHVQHPLVCNLTEAFSDPGQVYRSRIRALLDAQESQPVIQREFKPIKDTFLDLPLLTVTSCGQDMCLELQPPMEHLRDIYNSLNYKYRIVSNNAGKSEDVKETKSLERQILTNLASGRWYCVSVCFSPGVVLRESKYSQPVCASTPSHYTADPWISLTLCLLVMSGVVVLALLVYTRFTCLMRINLPSVITSIHHREEALLIPSYTKCCILNVEPTPPSSGDKRSSQTSDESDVESVTGSTAGGSEGRYQMRLGNNLLSSSSASSSSSLSDPFPPKPDPLTCICAHTGHSSDAVPISQTDSGSEGLIPENQGDSKLVGEVGNHPVDLDTITLCRLWDEVEQMEKLHSEWGKTETESSSFSEDFNPIQALPPLTGGTEEACYSLDNEEEEEEEDVEHFGYMQRSCELQN
ncbi:interferon alpha/beta receptor 2-like isoform 1-T9 [Spinachia spinachia]